MKVSKLSIAVAALAGMVLSASAFAQKTTSGISVEVGGNYATDSTVRDVTNDWGWRVGLGYDLPKIGATTTLRGRTTIGASYAENKRHDSKLTVWGLDIEQRMPFSSSEDLAASGPYWGAGIGVYRDKAESPGFSESKTRLGLRGILGYDITSNFYAEASYNYTGKVADVKTDGIVVAVGTRF